MPSDQSRTTEPEANLKSALERAIGHWVDDQIAAGNPVPDFWDECGTSEALAEHLVQLGWHR